MGGNTQPIFASTAKGGLFARVAVEVREDGLYVKCFPPHFSFRHVPFAEIASVAFTDGKPRELSRGVQDLKEGYERAKEQDGFTTAGTALAYTVSENYPGAIRINRPDQRPITISTDEPRALAEAIARTEPSISVESQ